VSELPQVMSVAVYQEPGVVIVEERPVPRPGPGEVLIEVDHCGICGSDIHMLRDGWGNKPGLIAGHEYTGVIAAVGDGVPRWVVGDRVVGASSPKCGHCRRCLENKPSQCENRAGAVTDGHDGAFAEFVLTRAVALLALPDGLSLREAALAEPMAVALHGITRSGVGPGDSVMVIGAGPIGALSIAALRARDLGPITAVEPSEKRKALAKALGADTVLDPDELEVFAPWEPERIATHAAHVVLECSGHKAAMEAGFHQLRRGGTLALVGAGVEHPTFDPNRFILNELSVCGSFIYDKDGFEHALELLASGLIPNHLLIEPMDVGLDQISTTLDELAGGRVGGKVLVVPRLAREIGAP